MNTRRWRLPGRGWWLGGIAASLALLLLAVVIAPFDVSLALSIRTEKLPGDVRRFLDLSELWGHGFGALLVSLTAWLTMPGSRRRILCLAGACMAAGLLTNTLKLFCWRWRPGYYWTHRPMGSTTWLSDAIDAQVGGDAPGDFSAGELWEHLMSSLNWEHASQSFPSGHSASAVALALGMTRIAPRGAPIFWTLACAACLQRISFNSHWPSDVLVGAAIGLISATLVFARFDSPRDKTSNAQTSAISSEINSSQKLVAVDATERQFKVA